MPLAYRQSQYETGIDQYSRLAIQATGGGAFTHLFEAGDHLALPRTVPSEPDFRGLLACGAFRGAIWATDGRLYVDQAHPAGPAVGASFRWYREPGFTPLRWRALHTQLPTTLAGCLRGSELMGPDFTTGRPTLVPNAQGAFTLELELWFKLDSRVDWAQWVFTRHRAPWAVMRFELALAHGEGGGSMWAVSTRGSYLPSQQLYVNWQSRTSSFHDMLGTAQHDIDEYISRGACVPAHERTHAQTVGEPLEEPR